jgi:hypothetical protein
MNEPQKVAEYRTERMHMWLEPPDLVCVHPHGLVEEEDLLELSSHMSKHIRDWPCVLLFINQDDQTGVTAEARKAAATAFEWVPYRGTVFSGGSFMQRTIGQMILITINTMRGIDNPTKFFKTEPEARAWIDERRRTLDDERAAAKT